MARKCRQRSHMQKTTHTHKHTHTHNADEETQDGTKRTSNEACSRVQNRVHSLDRTSQPPGSASFVTSGRECASSRDKYNAEQYQYVDQLSASFSCLFLKANTMSPNQSLSAVFLVWVFASYFSPTECIFPSL